MALEKVMVRTARPTARQPTRPQRRGGTKTQAQRPAWRSQTLLTVVLLFFLAPFALMVLTALKPADQVFTTPPRPFGRAIEWGNFAQAWNYLPFGRFMLNGVIVSVLGTAVVLVSSILAGYAFARLRFRGRDMIFLAYLGTLMVPQEVLVVPMFVLMQKFGWVNSYQGLVLPWAFTAFGAFLLRQFFLTIPWELEEAATIDGARKLTILLRIMLPIARPAVAVLAVFTFINYWNSFLWPLIIVNTSNMATVPLGLDMFLGQHGNQWHLLMAASTISVVPSLIMVVVLQRYLVRGISLSGFAGR